MNITLRPEHEKLVTEKVRNGAYESPDEVVAAALQALEQREAALAHIRAQIEERFLQAERGELLDRERVFREIRERSKERRSSGP